MTPSSSYGMNQVCADHSRSGRRPYLLQTAGYARAVLDEALLRRPVGGRAAIRRQLHHLAEAAAQPNVRLQVLPFGVGAHPGMDGAFTVFRFAKPTDSEVVHLEHTTGELYLETAEEMA
jgi:hypothetical protein